MKTSQNRPVRAMHTSPLGRCIVLMFVLVALFTSCEKSKLILFDQPTSVFFPHLENNDRFRNNGDTLEIKFVFIQGDETVVGIPIAIMGAPVDYDRPVSFIVVDSLSTAKEGIHYKLLPDYRSSIRADRTHDSIRLVLMRAGNKGEAVVSLRLRLMPNEHFNTDFDSTMNTATDQRMRSIIDYNIVVSDTLTAPHVWTNPTMRPWTERHWGVYSETKYRIILRSDVGGRPACYWELLCSYEGVVFAREDIEPVGITLRLHIQRLTCQDPFLRPPRDENGRFMSDLPDFWETLDCSLFETNNAKKPVQIISID